jgi:hypothetical protein
MPQLLQQATKSSAEMWLLFLPELAMQILKHSDKIMLKNLITKPKISILPIAHSLNSAKGPA